MSDYLLLHDNNEDSKYAVSMFAHKLVAFFPKEGYAVFQGYCHLKSDELPYIVLACRMNDKETTVFEIRIKEVLRKIIQPPSWKQREQGINFFPSNIIILKFETDDEKNERWNFCIDSRFKSVEELVQRYSSLVDDPGFDGNGYFPREEDQEFYDEFSKFIRNG